MKNWVRKRIIYTSHSLSLARIAVESPQARQTKYIQSTIPFPGEDLQRIAGREYQRAVKVSLHIF
ncbi:hypothetical protein BH23BAC1_BH23BAC1_38010 [soil metagenome]